MQAERDAARPVVERGMSLREAKQQWRPGRRPCLLRLVPRGESKRAPVDDFAVATREATVSDRDTALLSSPSSRRHTRRDETTARPLHESSSPTSPSGAPIGEAAIWPGGLSSGEGAVDRWGMEAAPDCGAAQIGDRRRSRAGESGTEARAWRSLQRRSLVASTDSLYLRATQASDCAPRRRDHLLGEPDRLGHADWACCVQVDRPQR
jgi:hypothetical protein